MAYVNCNPQTKRELKECLARGEKMRVFQPGPFGPEVRDGKVTLEGPHFPQPHKWYATCQVEGGYIVPGSVK